MGWRTSRRGMGEGCRGWAQRRSSAAPSTPPPLPPTKTWTFHHYTKNTVNSRCDGDGIGDHIAIAGVRHHSRIVNPPERQPEASRSLETGEHTATIALQTYTGDSHDTNKWTSKHITHKHTHTHTYSAALLRAVQKQSENKKRHDGASGAAITRELPGNGSLGPHTAFLDERQRPRHRHERELAHHWHWRARRDEASRGSGAVGSLATTRYCRSQC